MCFETSYCAMLIKVLFEFDRRKKSNVFQYKLEGGRLITGCNFLFTGRWAINGGGGGGGVL